MPGGDSILSTTCAGETQIQGRAKPDPAAVGRDPAVAVTAVASHPGPDPAPSRPDPVAPVLDPVVAMAGGAEAGRDPRSSCGAEGGSAVVARCG